LEPVTEYQVPAAEHGETRILAIEEQGEIASRVTDQGSVVFFQAATGQLVSSSRLPIPDDVQVTHVTPADTGSRMLAAGLSNGGVLLFRQEYVISYPDNTRVITPEISFPYGEDILELDDTGAPIKRVALRETGSQLFLAAATSGNQLVAKAFDKSENFITGEVTLSDQPVTM